MDAQRQLVRDASKRYEDAFGVPPTIAVFAPGRVNLIGEHTDYNDGFVMPFAIPFQTVIVGSRTSEKNSNVSSTFSKDLEIVSFSVNKELAKGSPSWANYIKGTVAQYVDDLPPNFAFNACIASSVPTGSGLSSSAALEVATATFLETAAGGLPSIGGVQKALRCQKAEHTFADTPCGIMDQFISAMGRDGHLLLIDCRSQEYKLIPFGGGNASPIIIVTNSQVKHQLSGSEYPDRVRCCREAVAVIQKKYKTVKALRDATMEMLEDCKSGLSADAYKRAKHAITEDQRTLDTIKALEAKDYDRVGRNMTQSHVSLRDDFQVSCEELDVLVDIANSVPGVYGSRMTGGGFGGCTVTLCHRSAVSTLVAKLTSEYKQKVGQDCLVYPAMSPAAGCGVLPLQEFLASDQKKTAFDSFLLTWAVPIAFIGVAAVAALTILKKK